MNEYCDDCSMELTPEDPANPGADFFSTGYGGFICDECHAKREDLAHE